MLDISEITRQTGKQVYQKHRIEYNPLGCFLPRIMAAPSKDLSLDLDLTLPILLNILS